MANILNIFSQSHKSSAKVVDGKLILSFPGALKPVVWQMDFSHVKASALEVQGNEDGSIHALILKTPKGENAEIAAFDNKSSAVKGLLAASKALESAQGKIHMATATSGTQGEPQQAAKKKSGGRWVAPVLAILLLLILFSVWSALTPQAPSSLSTVNGGSQGSNADAVGVPMSAEDFLRGQ